MTSIPPPAALDKLAEVDSELKDSLDDLLELTDHQPYMQESDPEELMRQMRESFSKWPSPRPRPGVQEHETRYTTRDGASLLLCTYKPDSASEPLPLFVWYHGGGGCVGSPKASTIARNVASEQQCLVIAVQYRLAPEDKYPTGIDDCWDALKYIARNAESYGGPAFDPKLGFVVGGESAGAVIASQMALRARDEGLQPAVTGVFLSAGSYLNPNDIPEQYKPFYRSRYDTRCLEAPLLSKKLKAAFDACLQGDFSSPHFRAALSPTHKGLPKTYFQACGMDMNRDETFIYRDMLEKSGIPTKIDVYPGCPHCFWIALPDTSPGRKWREETKEGLKWLFAS